MGGNGSICSHFPNLILNLCKMLVILLISSRQIRHFCKFMLEIYRPPKTWSGLSKQDLTFFNILATLCRIRKMSTRNTLAHKLNLRLIVVSHVSVAFVVELGWEWCKLDQPATSCEENGDRAANGFQLFFITVAKFGLLQL